MKTEIIVLASVMGLDLSDINNAVFITKTLEGISDLDGFINFCRSKKDGIEYSTKTERLDTLATRYKKQQIENSLPYDTAGKFTTEILNKFAVAKNYIRDAIDRGIDRPISRIKVEGEQYFNDKELKALGSVSSNPSVLIEIFERGDLKDELIKMYMDKYIQKNIAIGNSIDKKVSNIIGNLSKNMV